MAAEPLRRPRGNTRWILLGIAVASLVSAWGLALDPREALPRGNLWGITQRFLAAALQPALDADTLDDCLRGAWNTLSFALAAMSLALVIGVGLGFLGSTAWWREPGAAVGGLRGILMPALFSISRLLIAVLRSVHELFWAVLLICALGNNPFSGVVAIAIPYGCTLAKVFAEMIDEAPRAPALALKGLGASSLQTWCLALVPQALPDMVAYAFYRFECTLRSAAILGFFGFETLGLFLKQRFDIADYSGTWTYLWALLVMVILADWWSGAFRRSFAR